MNITFKNNHEPLPKMVKDRTYSTISVCSSTTSLSSIIGSVTAYMIEFFKSKFPEEFFKDVYVSTTMAANAIKQDYFSVHKRPYLFVQPQYDLSPGIIQQMPRFFEDTSWIYLKNLRQNYNLIFEDSEVGIRVFNAFQRTKITYKFGIRVNSEIQGWNTISYINQNFENNGFYYINRVFIDNQLPPFITENIARRLGFDLTNPIDSEKMQQYMLKYSFNGIEEKTDLSTGNNRYMYRYPVNILVNYPDVSNSNKNMRNNITQNSIVEFNIIAELWTPSMFIMEMDNIERFKNIPLINPKEYDDGKYRFSLIMNEDYIPYNKDHMNMIVKRNFLPEVNVEYDELDLKPVLPLNVQKAVIKLREYHIPVTKAFKLDLYINGKKLFEENYKIHPDDLILKTSNPMKNTTYTLVLYADMEILNKINLLMQNDTIDHTKELDEYLKSLK